MTAQTMKLLRHGLLSLALLAMGCAMQAQIAITTGYSQDFNSIGTSLPAAGRLDKLNRDRKRDCLQLE